MNAAMVSQLVIAALAVLPDNLVLGLVDDLIDKIEDAIEKVDSDTVRAVLNVIVAEAREQLNVPDDIGGDED